VTINAGRHYSDARTAVFEGDCLERLRQLPDASVDAVVTDPPYGLANTDPAHVVEALTKWATGDRDFIPTGKGFMGKAWDAFVPPPAVWDECLRVLKPGGHLLAFAGSRTFDLMTLSIRMAGFDIRDSIAWLYGSGFPKSLDVSKAITGMQTGHGSNSAAIRRATMGADYIESGRLGNRDGAGRRDTGMLGRELELTEDARQWQGWGTALKPAFEPIVVARKPLIGTVAANVLEHGTGAINVDAGRIGTTDKLGGGAENLTTRESKGNEGWGRPWMDDPEAQKRHAATVRGNVEKAEALGRFPANVLLDESQAAALDEQSGVSVAKRSVRGAGKSKTATFGEYGTSTEPRGHDDTGGASRFFYVAKAPTKERPNYEDESGDKVSHATVKPLTLMRYLVKLVTPPGGIVLEPFAGSGTTIEAARLEGFRVIGIERDPTYLPLIQQRIDRSKP
jgi:DNA modification methylase